MSRPGPALFELLRDPAMGARTATVRPGGHGPVEAPATATRPAVLHAPVPVEVTKPRVRLATPAAAPSDMPTPEPKPVATQPAPASKAASPATSGGLKFQLRKPVTLSTSGFVLIGAGVLVAVLLVWVGAYSLGSRDGEAKTLKDKGLTAGTLTDPLRPEQIPVNGSLVTPEPTIRQASTTKTSKPSAPPTLTSSKQEVSATGSGASEIAPGLNYCVAAARLDRETAERAAGYLVQNGVGATAVQVVEGEWTGAKNAGSWMVVVTQGITGKEYGARAATRVDIESRLTKLGQAYRKDPKGRIDFGQFAWDKRK